MWRLTLFLLLAMAGLLKALPLHLAKTNENGTPEATNPFSIDNPYVAQAIYGKLGPEKPTDYYALPGEKDKGIRAMLLIPTADFNRGLRAVIRVYGPGLSEDGATFEASEFPLHIAGKDYILTQRFLTPLPESASYQIGIELQAGSGVYCLCVGDQEGGHTDPATRDRVDAMLTEG